MSRSTVLGVILVLTPVVRAQGPEPHTLAEDLVVPIHHAPGDQVGEHGTWAGGSSYKARFDGGFRFYPALGASYDEHMPLRWETVSVRIGSKELVRGDVVESRTSELRYEYRWSGLTEAYDVFAEGIEQTFVVEQRPDSVGSLVVSGRVTTPLSARRSEPMHGDLTFCGSAGERVIDYGAATAIDASGRRFAMTTAYDGERIQLELDARDVATAEFPIVVDPLLSSHFTARVSEVEIVGTRSIPMSGGGLVTRPSAVAFTRVMTATDHDAFMVACTEDLQGARLVMVDLAVSYSSERIAVGARSGAGPFGGIGVGYVAAVERRYGSSRSELMVYDVWSESTTINNGVALLLRASSGEHYRNPAIGGFFGARAELLIVYDRASAGANSVGASIANFGSSPSITELANLGMTSGEVRPSVSSRTNPWIACWTTAGGHSVVAKSIDENGLVGLTTATIVHNTRALHARAKIGGSAGPFIGSLMVTFETRPIGIGTNAVRARTFTWDGTATPPSLGPIRTLASGATSYANESLALVGDSQWLATFSENRGLTQTVKAVRAGRTGAVIDTFEPHAAVDRPVGLVAHRVVDSNGVADFACAYALASGGSNALIGVMVRLPSNPYVHTYLGSSCASTQVEAWDPSFAGANAFTLERTQPANVALAAVTVSLSYSGGISLGLVGMPGCVLLQPVAFSLPASGNRVSFALSDAPLFVGNLYTQWIYTDPGANALGIVTNRVVRHTVE